MIELSSVLFALLVESLGGLILLVLGFLFFSRKKSSSNHLVANDLIDKLEDTETIKVKKLGQLISETCALEQHELDKVLSEINESERILYQKIIQMFLNRDVELLQEIDQYIDQVSEPYCKLLSHSSVDVEESEKLEVAEDTVNKLMQENERMSEQLTVAMNTMDEISAEYTRVFNGTQTELELENSSKKMLKTFKNAEQQIKLASNGNKAEEL